MEKRELTYRDIENLSKTQADALPGAEYMLIKEHDVYLHDFGGYCGYSALVFKDGRHIHYADEFELHYTHMELSREVLREKFIERLNGKLFTDAEIAQKLTSYTEYGAKQHYLQCYYPMRREYISVFFIGSDAEREHRLRGIQSASMIYDERAFAYFYPCDTEFVKRHRELCETLDTRRAEAERDFEYLKDAFIYEMANHEYAINWQGNWDVLSCFGKIRYVENDDFNSYFRQLNFKPVQIKAFLAARCEYMRRHSDDL